MTLDLRHAYKGLPLLGVIHNACSDDHIFSVLGYTTLKSHFSSDQVIKVIPPFLPEIRGFPSVLHCRSYRGFTCGLCIIKSARPLYISSPTLERSNKGAKCRRNAHPNQATLRPRPVKPACLGTFRASTRISFQRCALISTLSSNTLIDVAKAFLNRPGNFSRPTARYPLKSSLTMCMR